MPSPLTALPGGTVFGTLVHDDPRGPGPAAAGRGAAPEAWAGARCRASPRRRWPTPCARCCPHRSAASGPRWPASPAATGWPSWSSSCRWRAGTTGRPHATLADVVALLRRHDLGALAGYPDVLATLDPVALRGFLTGSIDAVLRLPGPRYVVVDYKTNRLGAEPLTTWHYRPEAMAAEMLRAHYVLQALLYSVALHRYLRWRQPGYDPARHLGPVLYLFVRGMTGPQNPGDSGVFTWSPGAALVVELSDLLAGRRVIPMRAPGLLRAFCDAGVLVAADVHVALRLERLGGEDRRRRPARRGAGCAGRAHRVGVRGAGHRRRHGGTRRGRRGRSSCHGPRTGPTWPTARWSPSVPRRRGGRCGSSTGGCTWTGTGSRSSWSAANWTSAPPSRPPVPDLSDLDVIFKDPAPDRQRLGAAMAAGRWVSVLTGGPGTGKTHTVARLLKLLSGQPGPAAPHRPGRADREGRRPAAGVGPRAGRPTWASPWTWPRPHCTGCSAGARTAAAGSGTTPATTCPTTSSWSTRRR